MLCEGDRPKDLVGMGRGSEIFRHHSHRTEEGATQILLAAEPARARDLLETGFGLDEFALGHWAGWRRWWRAATWPFRKAWRRGHGGGDDPRAKYGMITVTEPNHLGAPRAAFPESTQFRTGLVSSDFLRDRQAFQLMDLQS